MRLPSTMNHQFSRVPRAEIPRSSFDRSHGHKTTFDAGLLIPIYLDEALPGDTFNMKMTGFARLATPLHPFMDNLYLNSFFFAVPMRLVWDNWEKFNGAQDNPGDSTDFTVPQVIQPWTVGSIGDKFGLPNPSLAAYSVNSLPFRAYNLIWNEWFRDQDLQDSVTVETGNGPDVTPYQLLKRCKVHDYFTSMRPWPQKAPDVLIPVSMQGGLLPVERVNNAPPNYVYVSGTNTPATSEPALKTDSAGRLLNNAGSVNLSIDPNGAWNVDVDGVNLTGTINDLRLAFQMQQLFEMDARGGTRYVELLYSTWGVVSPDFRLQRPEYIGGGHIRFNSHPVPQTAPTDGANAQGSLAAFGTASNAGSRIGFNKSFVEHGYVIGLCAARGDITYQQGINRMWTRQTRYDFFQPALENIGEQPVFGIELCADADDGDYLTQVIGYQERYAEYKYKPSEIRGEFRSTYATPLDQWHLAEEYDTATPPELDEEFIQSSTPIERNLPITSNPPIFFNAYFKLKHSRVMQTRPVPLSLQRL